MRVSHSFIAVCLAALAMGGQAAQAQVQLGTPQAQQARPGRYEKGAETTVSGTVTAMQAQLEQTLPRGTYLTVKSGGSLVLVHMGLYSQKNIPFKTGAQVTVIGALATVGGTKIFLAREVQSGGQTIAVRSPNGFVLRPHNSLYQAVQQ